MLCSAAGRTGWVCIAVIVLQFSPPSSALPSPPLQPAQLRAAFWPLLGVRCYRSSLQRAAARPRSGVCRYILCVWGDFSAHCPLLAVLRPSLPIAAGFSLGPVWFGRSCWCRRVGAAAAEFSSSAGTISALQQPQWRAEGRGDVWGRFSVRPSLLAQPGGHGVSAGGDVPAHDCGWQRRMGADLPAQRPFSASPKEV